MRAGALPRVTALLAALVGAAGLLTVIPAMGELSGALFGLGAILWFLLVGLALLRHIPGARDLQSP